MRRKGTCDAQLVSRADAPRAARRSLLTLAHMDIPRRLGLWALSLAVALWAFVLLQWFVVCPLIAVPLHPPVFEPGFSCQLKSVDWFIGLLLIPLVTGALGFKQMRLPAKILFGLVVMLPYLALLIRWAYMEYVR